MAIDIGVRNAVEFVIGHPYLLLGAVGLYFIVFLTAVSLYGKKPGKNPFASDHRKPKEPFVHDSKVRDAILKQRFKLTKVPENLDAIVIGSGIGGLTTAVLLGRAGKKVLVLEQHDQAGGCCHTFVEKGFEFDTGIHYIGHLEDGHMNRTLLDQMTCGQLQWKKMDDAFDTVVITDGEKQEKFPMKSGEERYWQNLRDMFPKEKEVINKYIGILHDAAESFIGLMILKVLPRKLVWFLVNSGLYRVVCSCYRKGYVRQSLQDVIDSLTDNKKLKVVLSYICGDYGVPPREVPFVFHAVVVQHYLDGAYYPKAGSSEIAFHLIHSIQKAGGRVLVQAPVTQILCDASGKATGVKVGGKNDVDVFAKNIVSNTGVYSTFKYLLPEKVAKRSALYPLTKSVGPSLSYITAFFGLEGSPKELNLPAGNLWVYKSNDINATMDKMCATKAEDVEDVDIPFAYISFPGAKDSEWEVKYPDKSTMIVITLAKFEWFEEWQTEKVRGRGDRYEGIKSKIGREMWSTALESFPQLDGKCVYTEVGTPVTNQYYLGGKRGEMYGLDHGAARFTAEATSQLRADTDIPGLYLAGQDIMSAGFSSALLMGVFTCGAVLNRNVYNDLRRLNKKEKAQLSEKALNGMHKVAPNGVNKAANGLERPVNGEAKKTN